MKLLSEKRLRQKRDRFWNIKTIDDLAVLTSLSKHKLLLIAGVPQYHEFFIPKRDGRKRWIENPVRKLKEIQRTLNNYLQAVYYFQKTEAAYGFLISARGDPNPRNILTNAAKHLDAKWLMNADLEDFFHYVKAEMVFQIFSTMPFGFSDELSDILTQLTTYKGRLPMGAPTSPVLSNFATIELDGEISNFAHQNKWIYSRYADDMSFSSLHPIEIAKVEGLRAIADKHGFKFNESKLKLFGPEDEKTVTGLRLGEEVELSREFAGQLNEEIFRLRKVMEARALQGKPPSLWVQNYQRQVEGQLNFAAFVMGEDDPDYIQLEKDFAVAIDPPGEFSAVNWLDFPYH
jgi:RNA-directed DNA polymerase